MKKITRVVAAMAIGAAAISIGIAPPAGADTSNCQTVGASTICGQGGVTNGVRPPVPQTLPSRPLPAVAA